MALQYKFLDRPKDIDSCLAVLGSTIIPLLKEHWDKFGKPEYGKDFNLNTEAFVSLWINAGFVLVLAYDNDTPVGIIVGLRVSPMDFSARVLQVETCYGRTAEVEEGLYNYIESIAPIVGYDELWISNDTNKHVPDINGMKLTGKTEIIRFSRE